jgi:hypothetical protein
VVGGRTTGDRRPGTEIKNDKWKMANGKFAIAITCDFSFVISHCRPVVFLRSPVPGLPSTDHRPRCR